MRRTFEAGGAPKRTTVVQQLGRGPSTRSMASAWSDHPGTVDRHPLRGSARTGQPRRLDQSQHRTGVGDAGAGDDDATRSRDVGRRPCPDDRAAPASRRPSRRCHGASPARPRAGRPPPVADQRLAERQVQMHRARRSIRWPRPRPRAPRLRQRRGRRHRSAPGSANHRTARAVQPGLVDGLRCTDVTELGWAIGGDGDAAARRSSAPRRRPGAARPLPCRSS